MFKNKSPKIILLNLFSDYKLKFKLKFIRRLQLFRNFELQKRKQVNV